MAIGRSDLTPPGGPASRVVRRPGPLVVALVGVAIVALVVVWFANEDDDFAALTGSPALSIVSIRASDPDARQMGTIVLEHERGAPFSYALRLHNDDPIPVRIVAVRPPRTPYSPNRSVVLRTEFRAEEAVGPPYTVPAGDDVLVLVRGRFLRCMEQDARFTLSSVGVAYEKLGRTGRTEVELPTTISIVGAPGETCPTA